MYRSISIIIHLDVDDVRATTNGTILDIRLTRSFGQIQRYHDLLATGIAYIVGLFLRRGRPFAYRFESGTGVVV
jgi:hypothetical protein